MTSDRCCFARTIPPFYLLTLQERSWLELEMASDCRGLNFFLRVEICLSCCLALLAAGLCRFFALNKLTGQMLSHLFKFLIHGFNLNLYRAISCWWHQFSVSFAYSDEMFIPWLQIHRILLFLLKYLVFLEHNILTIRRSHLFFFFYYFNLSFLEQSWLSKIF